MVKRSLLQASSGGRRKDKAAGHWLGSELCVLLQQFDTAGCVSGRASGPEKICASYPKRSLPEEVEEENQEVTC